MNSIVLLAHRGTNPYPDHSREAYVWAVNYGADYIEPDLYLTKDGVLVASHDDHGYANLTYAEVLEREPSILTFSQVIEIAQQMSAETGRKIGLIPETKSSNYATSEALIRDLVAAGFTDPERVIIQSFNNTNLQALHDTIMPQYGVDLPLAYLGSGISNLEWAATFADYLAPVVNSFTAEDVAAAHAAGLKVATWTILGAQADIQKYVDMGVDAIFVDDTALARQAIDAIDGKKTVFGSAGWEALAGSDQDDVIYAMQDDDIVRAGRGNDMVFGDAGNDMLFAGAGDDAVLGGAGNDFLSGDAGRDTLAGGIGNDVIVASGDEVVFAAGDGVDLVVADKDSTIRLVDIASTEVQVLRAGDNLVLRMGGDAVVIHNGAVDAGQVPASVSFADGVTLSGAEIAQRAISADIADLQPILSDLEQILRDAPALAQPSDIPLGADLIAEGDFAQGTTAATIEDAETGAAYRLSLPLSGNGDSVTVIWGGTVIHDGPVAPGDAALTLVLVGGAGDGSNLLSLAGSGATLDSVEMIKLTEAALPSPGNHAPVAQDAQALVSRDIALRGTLDVADQDGQQLSYLVIDGPKNGTVTLDGNGGYTYSPASGFSGPDSFTYLASDGRGGFAQASISFDVRPGIVMGTDLVVNGSFEDLSESTDNNGPSDWGYRNLDGTLAGWRDANGNRVEQHWDSPNNIRATDGRIWIDMDGYNTNTHLVQDVARVEDGAVYQLSFSLGDADSAASDDGIRVLWNGQLIYEGTAGNPWQSFDFRVTGGSGDGSNRLEFIAQGTNLNTYGAALDDVRLVKLADTLAEAGNDFAPEAEDVAATIANNRPLLGALTATDGDGDAELTFALLHSPANGQVTINADGTYSYQAKEGYVGTDSFTFTVTDPFGASTSATVQVDVTKAAIDPVNLIVNGGFEDLTGANDAASWGYRNTNPAGVIAGWQNVGDDRAEIHKDSVGGISAAEGSFWFDMEGAPNNARLTQTVDGVKDGATYTLTFSIADTDTTQSTDSMAVYWGGQEIYRGTPKDIWQTISIDVTGGAGDGSNTLVFASTTSGANGAGVALDDISLFEIAENPNLIVNGSFEDLTGTYNGNWKGDWGYRNDNGLLPGWTQTDKTAGGRAELHYDTQNGISAKDGKLWFDMDGIGNNARLVQDVQGVEDGATYQLRFWIADADARSVDDGVRVLWGGEVVYEGVPGAEWQEVVLELTGHAGDGLNQLVFQGTQARPENYGAALDDISLRKIADAPAPNTAPVAADDQAETTISAPATIDLLANDSDADGDGLQVTALDTEGTLGQVTLNDDGTASYDPSGAFGDLLLGEFATDEFRYTVSDGSETASAVVRVRIEGEGRLELGGTAGADRLQGGDRAEAIAGGAGSDNLYGGAGADLFVFGAETENGRRETDYIRDYDIGVDSIDLGTASISRVTGSSQFLRLTLDGDQDMIVIYGVDSLDDLTFTSSITDLS